MARLATLIEGDLRRASYGLRLARLSTGDLER